MNLSVTLFLFCSIFGIFETTTSTIQCVLKDNKLKCGNTVCQVTMGSPTIPPGKYRIGNKQTESAEGLPSHPFYYVYKAINGETSKGYWSELTYIPELRCTKETPWMNSESLAVAHSFGFQSPRCYNNSIKPFMDGLSPKSFDVKVCPSPNGCKSGQCANLATLGTLTREYLTDLVVE